MRASALIRPPGQADRIQSEIHITKERIMNKIIVMGAAAAAAFTLTACGATEVPAAVVEPAVPVVTEAAETETESGFVTTPIGTTVNVGDWDVTVTEINENANNVIAGANMWNDKPEDQYVLVTYSATYIGSERKSDVGSDLSWSLTGGSQSVYDVSWQVTPADDKEWPTEARKGGTVKAQVLFDVDPDELDGALVTVEGWNESFETVYADFAL